MSRIAFLGLGAMGSRMASRLLAAGHTVTVWNRSPEPALALQAQGAWVAASPRAAVADAEVVISMVFDDAASRAVWLDERSGAALGLATNALAIESSTLTPAWLHELGRSIGRRKNDLVDAPVAGSRPQATAGQLIFMAGGEAVAVERARPLLLTLGGTVHHVGPLGSGAWLKLVVNALFATQVAAVAEQLALLRKAGLNVETALAALKTMPVTSAAAAGAASLMVARDFSPQAPVDLIAKDLTYVLHCAEQVHAPMPLTGAVADRFRQASAAGHGTENLVAVSRLLD